MGRGARLKASRRNPGPREQSDRLEGIRADERGRRVGPSLSDYIDASSKGHGRIREALLARHNRRMERLGYIPEQIYRAGLGSLASTPNLYLGLRTLGANLERHPADYFGAWENHLLWGVDSAIAAARLLLAGQYLGAAAIARSQMERWTMNLSYNLREERSSNESASNFINRIWSLEHRLRFRSSDRPDFSQDGPAIDAFIGHGGTQQDFEFQPPSETGAVLTLNDGWGVNPGQAYVNLSEMLHGRLWMPAVAWDSVRLLESNIEAECLAPIDDICAAINMSLRRIRACAGTSADIKGNQQSSRTLHGAPDRLLYARNQPPDVALWPMNPFTGASILNIHNSSQAVQQFEAFLRGREARKAIQSERVLSTFLARRAHSAQWARKAMTEEEKLLGDAFNETSIAAREGNLVLVSELAGLIGSWQDSFSTASNSFLVAASALRSATWLWLEDDDRAMACLRVVLEHSARARTWRTKPNQAQKIDDRKGTPRDWLEGAGWKRLGPLNNALGELAHTRAGSRWVGARELLSLMQPNPLHGEEHRMTTGRGHALDLVASLLAGEVLAAASELSKPLADACMQLFKEQQIVSDASAPELDRILDFIWTKRSFGMGAPSFTGPANHSKNILPSDKQSTGAEAPEAGA